MIQILNYRGEKSEFNGKDIVINSFAKPESLDSFDINILDFTDSKMWESDSFDIRTVNNRKDLYNLEEMISRSQRTKIVKIFPQDSLYRYGKKWNGTGYVFKEKEHLKNMLNHVFAIVFGSESRQDVLYYENTKTEVGSHVLPAAFYFDSMNESLLESKDSKKATAIRKKGQVLTTVEISTVEELKSFLRVVGLIEEKEKIPCWIEEMHMFDDNQQYDIILRNEETIKESRKNIDGAREAISKNNKYKSILYTSGDELVEVVFEILEEILGCDLKEFEDKKKEDFLTSVGEHIFIGEIKGVNHNVKSENVSQLDVHYQNFLEEHPEIDAKNVHSILIMDHQKNKPIQNREPVHSNQIALAKRNGSLIIDTYTLLRLYEKYVEGKIDNEDCVNLLSSNTGLLVIE